MRVVNDPRMPAHDPFPVLRQQRVIRIGLEILRGLKIPHEAVSVIKNQGNAVLAVACRSEDFTFDSEPFQKRSAFIRGNDHGFRRINRRVFPFFPGEDIVRIVNGPRLGVQQKQMNPLLLKLTDQAAVIAITQLI